MVSVCMITYNHEKYISQAIEGVLMQKTKYPIQLIIGEDCSTDSTRMICEEYAKNNQEIICLLPSDKNLGMMSNFIRTLDACDGKYIAFCEGDDYWIDPRKLQKQYDCLTLHKDCVMCFHDLIIFNDDKSLPLRYYVGKKDKNKFNIIDIIRREPVIHLNTLFFQKDYLCPIPDKLSKYRAGDYILRMLLALRGSAYYDESVMSVYRRNEKSISYNDTAEEVYEILSGLYEAFNECTGYVYDGVIKEQIKKFYLDMRKRKSLKKYRYLYYFMHPKDVINKIMKKPR